MPNTIHLVCSSGGVKCFSYIGAVQKLYERDVTIASVSACSIGTLMAALICSGKDISEIEKAVTNFDFSKLRKRKLFPFVSALRYPFVTYRTPDYAAIMKELLGEDITLEQMKIPFSAAALDIRQKRFLVYSSGTHPKMKISEVIRIATAVPGMYEPYKLDKRLLVDASVATGSPVWIAASSPGSYPIVVLKTMNSPNEDYKKNIFRFVGHLFAAASVSHDYFLLSQTPRSIEVPINCENIDYANFSITKDQVENLILQGQDAMEQTLREFNYDLNNVLEVEEVKSPAMQVDNAGKAAALATQMITSFQQEAAKRSQIFVSYSHNDRDWLLRIQTYFRSIERFTGIKTWDDTNIQPGEEWDKAIERALMATKVAVFLVTPDFLASGFIQTREMQYFLEISSREKVPILWIAVSDSLYDITPLQKIQCANDPKRPLDALTHAEQNTELAAICRNIIKAMNN